MQHVFQMATWLLVGMLFINILPANSQKKKIDNVWQGKLRDGTTITKEDLSIILENHKKWVETQKKEGRWADLSGADLSGADLSGANLTFAKFAQADLTKSQLKNTLLPWVNLFGARLNEANLRGVKVFRSDLRMVNLSGADLTGASIRETDLTGAKLFVADLSSVIFEPKAGTLPNIQDMATAHNLFSLRFLKSPHALIELRGEFKKAGFQDLERQITYAIKHTERQNLWRKQGVFSKIESLFNFILFEVTCQYGMSPGRALRILAGLILLFSIPYMIALRGNGKDGIWAVRVPGRLHKGTGKEKPIKLTTKVLFRPLPSGKLGKIKSIAYRWLRIIRISLYFSLLSAFHIGWRELNVGNWITRLQRSEYVLRAHGWVRTISGIQSLISVSLMALWVLTYFGRPFG